MNESAVYNPQCLTKLSKKLSWLLRHGAQKEGIPIQNNGFVRIADILRHPNYRDQFSKIILRRITDNDSKQRYTIQKNPISGEEEIRANQGHTLPLQNDAYLVRIWQAADVPMAVHGSYMRCWPSIRQNGLSRMQRNHIHFAVTDVGGGSVSGFRNDCDLLIYLDVEKVLRLDEMQLYRSQNNVILCSGLQNGYIPCHYFQKVRNRCTGEILEF